MFKKKKLDSANKYISLGNSTTNSCLFFCYTLSIVALDRDSNTSVRRKNRAAWHTEFTGSPMQMGNLSFIENRLSFNLSLTGGGGGTALIKGARARTHRGKNTLNSPERHKDIQRNSLYTSGNTEQPQQLQCMHRFFQRRHNFISRIEIKIII